MDIFNRPPSVAEDTLEYRLYPPSKLSDKASITTFAACISTYVENELSGFIWNRDPFETKVVADPESSGWLLEGRMRVGDCVDDEWCAVWLLKEISSKWDLVISVLDSDGEFLLIEAAESLPTWVNPTNSENRVWIYKSRLHLISLSHTSLSSRKRQRRKLPGSGDSDEEDRNNLSSEDFISENDAIKVVRDPEINSYAPIQVEQTVWARISGYPGAIKNHIHRTKALIPVDIAGALSADPHLVQKAVETFYTRDAIQLRAAHRMSRFPPDTSVLTPIRMTRTAYAQLAGQKFFPPRIFGRWEEKEGTKEWRWRDVGMKIAVGFEMLYQESKRKSSITTDSIQSSAEEALRRNPEYLKYIENLNASHYFQGQVEGSELWKKLETKAAAVFLDVRRPDDATRQSFASLVEAALSQEKHVLDDNSQEDSDDWLNIDAGDFEQMLESTMGTKSKTKANPNAMDVNSTNGEMAEDGSVPSEQVFRLKDLASKVENFVEGEGDLEGARFSDDESSNDEFSEEEFSDSDTEARESTRKADLDKLVPALEASEYGKMPASFHRNSQRVAPTTVDSEVTDKIKTAEAEKLKSDAKPIRQPILPRDKYDGVDSDDDSDEDDVMDGDEDSEEDRPQVVGDIEIDMGEEEEEFLEFSRQALGITNDQWNEIINDRKTRGAFLPASAYLNPSESQGSKTEALPARNTQREPRAPAPGPRPGVNPNLDSFEAVMQAMDTELARNRQSQPSTLPKKQSPGKGKGKGKGRAMEVDEVDDDIDIEGAMEDELKAALDYGEDEEDGTDEPMDYNLIKNFLESFKSQAGLSGPVSNLVGRLQPEWKLPRDES